MADPQPVTTTTTTTIIIPLPQHSGRWGLGRTMHLELSLPDAVEDVLPAERIVPAVRHCNPFRTGEETKHSPIGCISFGHKNGIQDDNCQGSWCH